MISFIIVNYNTKDLTYKTICSLENAIEHENFEIITIDNASNDGSKEFFKQLQSIKKNFNYIYLNESTNFSKAYNIGVKSASGKFVVIVRPGVEINRKGFDKFIFNNLKEDIGILSPKVIYYENIVKQDCKNFTTLSKYFFRTCRLKYLALKHRFFSVLSGIVLYSNYNEKSVEECEWVSDICIILRKNLFDEIGGFDENYAMYFKDEDLCQRVKDLGYKIVINTAFTVMYRKNIRHWYNNNDEMFLNKFKDSIYFFYKQNGILYASIIKYYFIISQLIHIVLLVFKLDIQSLPNKIKCFFKAIKYSVNKNGIAIVGYYGEGNIGDEFILHSLLKLENRNKKNNFFILSGNPKQTKVIHKCNSFKKKSILGNLLVFLSSSKLIIGGGGLFLSKNTTSYIYFFLLACLYRIFGKPVYISRVGVDKGALNNKLNLFLFRGIAVLSDTISVRDEQSLEEIVKHIPDLKDKISLKNDYVIEYLENININIITEKRVGLSLMNVVNYDYTKIYMHIKHFISLNYKLMFYVFFKEEGDLEISHEFIQRFSIKNYEIIEFNIWSPSIFTEVIQSLSKNEIFISMRLHPLIISHLIGIKTKAVSHNSKIKSFAQKYNIEEIQ